MPVERSKVAVIPAAVVVPINAEDMQVAAYRFGKGHATVGWVGSVIEVERFVWVGSAGDAFDGLIEHSGNGNGSAHTLFVGMDWLGLRTEELAWAQIRAIARFEVITVDLPLESP